MKRISELFIDDILLSQEQTQIRYFLRSCAKLYADIYN